MIEPSVVQEAARRLALAHPDKRNPYDGTLESMRCLYTSNDDTDDHCYAGQILIELGVPLPEANLTVGELPYLLNYLRLDAWELLGEFQRMADCGRVGEAGRLTDVDPRMSWLDAYRKACRLQSLPEDLDR